MKQNITISLDKEVLRKGKILAAMQGTSLTLAEQILTEDLQASEVIEGIQIVNPFQ